MRKILLSSAALAALTAAPALAQSTLETTIVTAPHIEETLPEELAKYGTRVETITSDTIKDNGYLDAAGALNAIAPGLYVQSKNGPFDYVDISYQGSRTEDVLWLVDGVRINNRLYAGTTPLDTIPSSIIDRIQIVDGAQSLFYGTQSVAGTVNIITKDYTTKPAGAVSLRADSNSGYHVDGNFSDQLGQNQFVLFGSADKSKGFEPFRKQDYQPSETDRNRSYDVLTLGGKYAYNVSEQMRFSTSLIHTDADLDYAAPDRIARDVNTRNETLLTAKVDDDISDKFGFYVKGYYHWWYTHYDQDANSLTKPGTVDVIYRNAFWGFTDYGVNALTKYTPGGPVDFYAGYDLQRYGGHDDVLFIEKHDETTNAVFGQIRTTPDLMANGNLALGARYNMPSDGESAFVWDLTGIYNLTPNLFTRGSVGTSFRLPTAEELFANDPADELGNPNLKPERSTNANVSLGGKLGNDGGFKLNWEVIGFWREIKDLIDLDTFNAATGQDVFGNIPGTVHSQGAELNLQAAFTPDLSAMLDYTLDTAKTSGSSVQIGRIPKQDAKLGLDWHPADLPIGFSANLNHVGDIYQRLSSGLGLFNYGNYTVLDLGARWFMGDDRRHRIDFTVQNVTDEKYGRPVKACADNKKDSFYACSLPYAAVNLGLTRTFGVRYTYSFN